VRRDLPDLRDLGKIVVQRRVDEIAFESSLGEWPKTPPQPVLVGLFRIHLQASGQNALTRGMSTQQRGQEQPVHIG
jgi:hypothetical protein